MKVQDYYILSVSVYLFLQGSNLLENPAMEFLPDDVWHKILQIGIESERLDHTDLCSLAIVNHHFDQLTRDPVLWEILLSHDFGYAFQAPSKALYVKEFGIRRRSKQIQDELWNQYWFPMSIIFFIPTSTIGFDDPMLHDTSYSRLSSQLTTDNSGYEVNIDDHNLFAQAIGYFSSHEQCDPLPLLAGQPNFRSANNHYYKRTLSKRFDKLSKRKVIPSTKSYIRMNRPPRRAMPRKI